MKTIELLPKEITYYKANLHCHTILSDGRLTPTEVKQFYQEYGYSVVAFTDHNVYACHSSLNDRNFLAIAAMESDINETGNNTEYFQTRTYHFNWYDTRPDYRTEEKLQLSRISHEYQDMKFLNNLIRKMSDMGFLACYNHPYWSLQNYEDYKELTGLWAMEIYNHGCETDGMCGYQPQAYEEMLRAGRKLYCISTDDNHNKEEFKHSLCDSFGGYIMIGAKELSYTGIMEALQNGRFYSCTVPDGRKEAPAIQELSLTGKKLYIKCSPADRIFVKTSGRTCYREAAEPGEAITEASFFLQGNEGYIHVDIYDGKGRHTNSNAYFLEDILSETRNIN